MRRTQLSWIVVAIAMSVGPSSAHAQANLSDTQWVKPLMMMLVDTSGSMERRVDETQDPDCDSTDQSQRRNRWVITLEALTGSFTSVKCTKRDRATAFKGEFDENYFLPHYDYAASYSGGQATDGILDSYVDRAKFALMTFDGVLTTTKGATLVPFASYGSDADVRNDVLGAQGMYSYPAGETASISMTAETPSNQFGWKPLAFPGCPVPYGVNAGARSKDASVPGSLISMGKSEAGTDIKSVNASIQDSLKAVRPYGGTPIAAMLDDFRYYLRNDADVRKGSDPFYACRKRYAVLLTDGAPDALFRDGRFRCQDVSNPACPLVNGVPRCQCPYDTEENLATQLIGDGLDQLWVVAFNVDATALQTLNRIAQAGKSNDALSASTPTQLKEAMRQVMEVAGPPATSRSVPVVINTGRPLTLQGAQYEITAGFQVGATDDTPWQGRLFRRRVECNGASLAEAPLSDEKGDMFHLTLQRRVNAGDDRLIRTLAPALPILSLTPNKKGSLFTGTNQSTAISASTTNLIKPSGASPFGAGSLGIVVGGQFEEDASLNQTEYQVPIANFDRTLSERYVGGTAAERNNVSDYVRGISAKRLPTPLADIYHSNPVAIPPVVAGSSLLDTFDPDLRRYYGDLIATTGSAPRGHYGKDGRPGVVFVGTNDGVLHAFNLDTWKNKNNVEYQGGYEFWGFVPPALFDNLPNVATPVHSLMFDGTPVVKDVILSRTSSSISMGTVLISAVRGAPAYVALDVTYPEETPKVLWQRSFGQLGETAATPAIAQVRVNWNDVSQVRAVAILPGGRGVQTSSTSGCDVDQFGRGATPNGGRTKVRCWKTTGRALYVVDIETGVLIQEFDARHFPSPMAGSVAVDGEGLDLTRAAYMSDEDGVLWRLSMLSENPSQWRVAPLWDVFAGTASDWEGNDVGVVGTPALAGRVASSAPVLVRDSRTGNLTILVGTGDIDHLLDGQPNRVVSLREARAMDGVELGLGTISASWTVQLDPYESVTGPISVLDDVAYFTTFTGPADNSQCLVGGSRIVGAHVRNRAASAKLPKGGLTPLDASKSATPDQTTVPPGQVLWYTPSQASQGLLLGLNISPDPVCVQGTTVNDPNAAGSPLRLDNITAANRGNYQLRTMVAGQGGTAIAGAESTAPRQVTRSIVTPSVARSVGWASSIE